MPRLRAWLGVIRLPRSSKMRPANRASVLVLAALRALTCASSLAWTASNNVRSTIALCSPLRTSPLKAPSPNIEAISKQMGERPPGERNSTDLLSRLERAHLGDDPALAQVGHQQIEGAKLEIAAEDGAYSLGFGFVDGDLSIVGVVAKRRHAADPKTLAFGG